MSHVVATINCSVYRMEFSVRNCCCFAQYLLLCCKRPVIRRMAILGPPLHDGLYSMAWTVVAGWRRFLDSAGVLADWNRSDMPLTPGEIQRGSCSSLS